MKKEKVVKQVVGIDVAQNELVVCLGRMYEGWTPELLSHKTFSNNQKGFDHLLDWVRKLTDPTVSVRFVMEATGVYDQRSAYFLHEQGLELSIILPNKISNYARTLDVKTITDKTASEAIALFGLERKLDNWVPPKGIYKKLQQLTRERGQLIDERTIIKNQLHAENAEAFPNKASIDRANKRIELLIKQEADIKQELVDLINQDNEVKEIVILLCSIPGIGHLTAVTILAETNGFELIRNKRQLSSYAGLDVREKVSGTSVKGKPSISKRGNKHLRKAMHLPALAAIRNNEIYKELFKRIVSKNGIKMKAAVAVQRKLLEMVYTIFKTKTKFDKNYFQTTQEKKEDLMPV